MNKKKGQKKMERKRRKKGKIRKGEGMGIEGGGKNM